MEAGDNSQVTVGDYGQASVGDCGIATVGHCGVARSGQYGTAIAGNFGEAIAGLHGYAAAGLEGIIQIRWRDTNNGRRRIALGYVGENGIKPGTIYRADQNGNLVEVSD